MADSSSLGSLLIHPGAVAAAAAPVHAIAVSVLDTTKALPSAHGAELVGEPVCAQRLSLTCRLIVEAITASSDGIDKLSQALGVAAATYRFADSDALAGWS
jgi:hypothetical protein